MTISLIAISVVFGCLLILFFIYSILGGFFSGMFKLPRKKPGAHPSDSSDEDETAAAIAMALRLYEADACHDTEPSIITIKNNPDSRWNDKCLTFRKSPRQ